MIAEDIDDSRSVMKRWLQAHGFAVIEAVDGQQAVELARQKCPDLILMDLNMPRLDGLAATEKIRECRDMCREVLILAITAYDTYGMKEAALQAGCDGYVTKPLDFERLDAILGRMLGG